MQNPKEPGPPIKFEAASQHAKKIHLETLVAVVVFGVIFGVSIFYIGMTFHFLRRGGITSSDAIFMILFYALVGIGVGFVLVRFFRRMFSVRRVVLLEGNGIGIVTWWNKMFMARLPDDVKHIRLHDKGDLTVTFRIEDRWLIVDSGQFRDKERINAFFHRFLDRYREGNQSNKTSC